MAAVKIVRTERNPLDWALDKLAMSRKDFQLEFGYNKSFLLRQSQGRHTHLSPRVLGDLYSLAAKKGIDLDSEIAGVYGPALSLSDAYQVWVVRHRKSQSVPTPTSNASVSPFMRLVESVGSIARTAALLAVPDTAVERYAKGVTYEMPMSIMVALTDMDYPLINQLDAAQRKWGADHA